MNCVIVENEEAARQLLTSLIQEFKPDIKIIGNASSIAEATHLINILNPELLFLDVELDDGQSFEILNSIDCSKCKIIFTTAYDNFAIEAFKFNAIDYLLKPFSPIQFVRAVDKAVKVTRNEQNYKDIIQVIQSDTQFDFQKLSIATESGLRIIDPDDIIRMAADGSYCIIFLSKGDKLISSTSLTKLESKLNQAQFKRVHKSHLVNIDHIAEFSYLEGGYLVLNNDDIVPVSRRKRQEILNVLKNEN